MSDDIDEYLDPEMDGTVAPTEDREPVPGPFSLSQLVFGIHALAAVAVVPFAWLALQGGNVPQFGTLTILAILLVTAGVVTARVAKRREP